MQLSTFATSREPAERTPRSHRARLLGSAWVLSLLVLLTAAPAMPAGLEFIENYDNGADGISGLNGAEAVAMSPDGAHVYAAGLESDAVTAFARNATTGELTFIAAYVDGAGGIDGLNGARAVTVSPDGKHVYAAGYQDGAVAAFSRDAGTGALTFVQAILDGSGSATKLEGAHGVTVSPDGAYVLVAANIDDAVTVFERDATTGALTHASIASRAMASACVSGQ